LKVFVESSNYFFRFAYGAYGWKALYGRRRGAKKHFQGLAVKARDGFTQANTDALLLHTGLKIEDIVDVQWKSGKTDSFYFSNVYKRTLVQDITLHLIINRKI
jgi:hypothetical protein